MNKKLLLPLGLVAFLGIAATTYTITQLTANTSPGDGTILEVYDPSASPKSGKYLLTNLTTKAQMSTATNSSQTSAAALVNDTAYDATTWNGDTTHAASKNAVRDKIEAIVAGGGLGSGDIDTSSELRGIVTDESGTGALIFAGGDVGAATGTTPAANDNDTSVATTAYVQTELADFLPLSGGTISGDLTVSGSMTIGTLITDDLQLTSLTETNKLLGLGINTNAMVATAAMVTNTLGMNLQGQLDLKANAAATALTGVGTVAGNLGALLSVGDTTFVDMVKASQTNSVTGALTFAHATNGVDGVDYTHVRWIFVPSGGPHTLTIPSGWRTNVYSAVPPALTNACITKMILNCGGPTGSAALQTNVYVSFEYFK
jgi:hypothetical protein